MSYACHPHTLGTGVGELCVQGRLDLFFEKSQGPGIVELANGIPFILGSQVKNTFVYKDSDIHMPMSVYIFAPTYFCILVCIYIKVNMNSYWYNADFGIYHSGFFLVYLETPCSDEEKPGSIPLFA